uniref:SWIM-type domain-containing protein n=1 Tax=Noccaea caerulescens TaxID=107243 RepID=A0A1J3JYS5_NOCCA
MSEKRVIAICISGGEFQTEKGGVLSYKGGEAHAIDVDEEMKFKDFTSEIGEVFNCDARTVCLKYFLPDNRKTLISISNDKDLQRMIKFHEHSNTADVYLLPEEAPPDISNMPASRSSRTTLSEAIPPAPLHDMIDDTTGAEEHLPLSASVSAPPIVTMEQVVHGAAADSQAMINPPESDIMSSVIIEVPNTKGDILTKARTQQWQNTITGVGQRFKNVGEFREALRKYAIANQFGFRYKKNDSHRVTVKCKAEGCPWRIHASRLSTTQLICIKKMNPSHTCEGAGGINGLQTSRSWVASIIKEKLKVFPNYKPKDIVSDIKEEYGIQLNYFQAWRGKEIAREQLQGSYKDGYKQLPLFCEKIMETNPGSLATFTTKEDSSFHRVFVSFHASVYGFLVGCRPLVFLDSMPLKSKYQGTLLAATSVDGDDEVFPLAFAVVDAETDDNWEWFLLQLRSALSITFAADQKKDHLLESCRITFVADRQKNLEVSIPRVFEGSFHAYCLRYLTEELIRDLKGPFSHEIKRLIVDDFYAAAYAPSLVSFERHVENIKGLSPDAYNWIVQNSKPDQWANAYLLGSRYNHMTSNSGEPFFSWASDANDLPITQMVDVIRGKIMGLIHARRINAAEANGRLTPSMEVKLEKECVKAQSLHVTSSADNKFQVRGETYEVVDMAQWQCTCRVWQLTGLPCQHAVAVLSCNGRSPYDFCSRYFTAESYRMTYSLSINPVPLLEGEMCRESSGGSAVTVTPPPTRRPPGRPPKKKTPAEEVMKRQLQCSRCKGLGHNKSTCKEYLLEC